METTPRPVPFMAGRYRCEQYLGGGMADVYKARDTELPRDVAIKILKPASLDDPDVRSAFMDEVNLASSCSHENIVMTYDKGEFDGSPFIVMEFLRGENLDKLIKNGQQGDLKRILQTALQIARGLEYVHKQNIVHRDLKPQNLHVDATGRVKLVDFGIAKSVDWNKTQVGMVKGTAYYMSPEQIMGEGLTFRTDIWSFGVVLYEMLCDGKRPFQSASLDTLWASIVNGAPNFQPMLDKQVPESVQRIVKRCLEKKAEDRYLDFGAAAADIQAELDALSMGETKSTQPNTPAPSTTNKKPLTVIIAGAVALVCIGLLAYHLMSERHAASAPLARELNLASGDMLLVDAGPALIGAAKHKVNVKAFYIDKTEVSNRAYAEFIKERNWPKPKDFPEDKPDLPVVNVTLYDAIAFANWAGKRLPSNEEWEKAARGPNGRSFPWGDLTNAQFANVDGNTATKGQGLIPVASLPNGASPYGALNMCGNVWEYVPEKITPSPEFLKGYDLQFKTTLSPDEFIVIRGGSFVDRLSPDLISDRGAFPAKRFSDIVGFRCAKSASPN